MQAQPPEVSDDAVLDAVRAGWVPGAASATYLPVGFGSHHWEVRDSAEGRWFATVDPVRADATSSWLDAALSVPRAARDAGVPGVHAPLAASDGALVHRLRRGWVLSVQEWLDGTADRFSARYDDHDAEQLVELLAGLHDVPVDDTRALRDRNTVPGRTTLEMWLARLDAADGGVGGPYGAPLRRVLREHAAHVERALAAHDARVITSAVGGAVATRAVPTHGEPHPANVIRTTDGVWLVDWDTALVAEPERDLWLVAGRTSLDVLGRYEQLTGRSVDPASLRHHERRWALADVAEFVPGLVEAAEETEDTRWQWDALVGTLEDLPRLSTRGT